MANIRWMPRFAVGAGLILGGLLAAHRAMGADGDDPLDQQVLGGGDLGQAAQTGQYTIELVGTDGKTIEDKRYLRGIPGQFSIREFPRDFALAGNSLFSAGTKLDSAIPTSGGEVKIYCKADSDDQAYKSICTATLPPGKYSIAPFNLNFQVGPTVISSSPALAIDGNTIKIKTAEVTFKCVSSTGATVPLAGLKLQLGREDLLAHLIDADAGAAAFCPLILYLPVGVQYESSMGAFSIDAQGKIVPLDAMSKQHFTGGEFVSQAPAAAAPEAVGKGYWLSSPLYRHVFKRGEAAPFRAIVSGEYPAGKIAVLLRPPGAAGGAADAKSGDAQTVGQLNMPAVSDVDSRLFLLNTEDLRPGKYELSVGAEPCHPYGIEIVDPQKTTPLFQFVANACGECDFTIDPAGLAQIAASGVHCFASYGFGSLLGFLDNDASDPHYPAASAEAPPELRQPTIERDITLDDMLRQGVDTIDYQNRRMGWYNEGLAFHHSQRLSVDREVRRTQIFAQETQDDPAVIGFSYTWFPSLGGYTEGGVNTDPFFETRMQFLRQIVKDKTGAIPLTQPEQQQWQKQVKAGAVDADLAERQRAYWRAEQHYGFFETFKLYDAKLHEVNPHLIATTSENAGHDIGKSMADLGGAHDVMSIESYTDFGDWPVSAPFVTDWVHAHLPGKPVYKSVDPSQDDGAVAAKAMYQFARGCEGISIGAFSPTEARKNRQRARINDFLRMYGPLATAYQPDDSVEIMVNELGFEYDAHALYAHLLRLGYGPNILDERTVENGGVPAGVKVIFLPNLHIPFSDACNKGLKDFMANGGKVVIVGQNCIAIDGATTLNIDLKNLWEVGGFGPGHDGLWREFHKSRAPLEKEMADLGLSPRYGADPEQAPILPMDAGGMHYVAVVSSPADTHDTIFTPVTGVKVKVGDAKLVVNLVTGATLPIDNGTVSIDLVNEPVALLALLDAPPAGVHLDYPAKVTAGQTIAVDAKVAFAGASDADKARAPVRIEFIDSGGKTRATYYRLTGDVVSYVPPLLDGGGQYTIAATELLTGEQVRATVDVAAAPATDAVAEAAAVYLPHPDRIGLFLHRDGEVRVIVEDTQTQYLPQAQRLVDALVKSGRKARVEQVHSSGYDTYWLRFFLLKSDDATMAQIDAGDIVGYRGDLRAYVNGRTRAFEPHRGGWSDISPNYIVRNDVILFSGGTLAQSLGQLSHWVQSADAPGVGQGVIDVALSPFWADRDALTVIARDSAGTQATVDRLIDLIAAGGDDKAAAPFAAPVEARADAGTDGSKVVPLDRPLLGFVPPALASHLAASPDGYALVTTGKTDVLFSPEGKIVGTAPAGQLNPQMLAGGTYFAGDMKITRRDPGWNFPTGWQWSLRTASAAQPQAARQRFDLPEDVDWIGDTSMGWNRGYAVSPDGKTLFAGREGDSFMLVDLASHQWRTFVPPERNVIFGDEVRQPLYVEAAAYSPDGKCIAYGVGCNPPGYGPLMHAPINPYMTGLRLVDAGSGKVLWRDNVPRINDSTLGIDNDCLAVSNSGSRIALIDYDHEAQLFDQNGKQLMKTALSAPPNGAQRAIPPIAVCITADGSTAMFACTDKVLVCDGSGGNIVTIAIPALCDARLALDGSAIYTADLDGNIACFDRAGKQKWTLPTPGTLPRLAATPRGVLVADGAGALLQVDGEGKIAAQTSFAGQTADQVPWAGATMGGTPLYREPQTLAILKQRAGAVQVAQWKPAGTESAAFGYHFHAVSDTLKLDASGAADHGQYLVHLVYRHSAPAGQGPSVTLECGGVSRMFVLDLPTPEYRAVDLPCEEDSLKDPLHITVMAAPGLEIAELTVYTFAFPGTNCLYVRTATMEAPGGMDDPDKPASDVPSVLDDTDPSQLAKAAHGKMKNAGIFSLNPDPDQVQGHYLRDTGNALDALDGQRFLDGKPSPWNKDDAEFGTRLLVDLGHQARPLLAATYDRTLRQSQVMRGIALLRCQKEDLDASAAGPDRTLQQPRALGGVLENDQFFNVFDIPKVDMNAFGVFVFPGRGQLTGLSEVELYE